MGRIAVLMACHNRVEKTLGCLQALFASELPAGTSLRVILVDDGSTDGTSARVRSSFPQVEIIEGTGDLYWNGGMRRAFERAVAGDDDHHLWLNDDTFLYPDALRRMIDTADVVERETGRPPVVVGTTHEPGTQQVTYGGQVRASRWKPLRLEVLTPANAPLACETFNGNCVLVPRAVYRAVGNLDATFAHAMGDTDYGFRVRRAGFEIRTAPGLAGACSIDHVRAQTYRDTSLPLVERWRAAMSPKGLPPRAWLQLTRRHGGLLWPLLWIWPYAKLVGTAGIARVRRTVRRLAGLAGSPGL